MIESFEVENFKCFESLKLNNLSRINIITGENASGKTALLEGFFAAARGNAEGLIFLNQSRGLIVGTGIPGLPVTLTGDEFPALWNHWFHSSKKKNADSTKYGKDSETTSVATKISFRYSDSNQIKYSCDFMYDPTQTANVAPQQIFAAGVVPFQTMRIETKPGNEPVQTGNIISLSPQGQLQGLPQLRPLGPIVFIFTAALSYSEADSVRWFSQLREKEGTQEITQFFKKNFPFIENLEILEPVVPAALYAILKSGQTRRLQMLSSGIHKITSILLACATARNGVVLIDEIENGIFYEKYELTWYILNKFAKQYNCQLFVTSHSAECLQALVPIMGDDVANFSLMRTERENGTCVVRHISGASMRAALKREGEIRGGFSGASSVQDNASAD